MSPGPIAASPDLQRLRNDGYGITVVDGALVVDPVPFVDAGGVPGTGQLIVALELAGHTTTTPATHVAYFAGGTPHDRGGQCLPFVANGSGTRGGLAVAHSLSTKPASGRYTDYHEQVTTYATAISSHAEAIDSAMTARPHLPSRDGDDNPLTYADTASARNGTSTAAFHGLTVAIVGLGGTGSYLLDLIAKLPVAQIHLWDGDRFHTHNAFRAPGAASLDVLTRAPYKVDYLAEIYAAMHTGLVAHPVHIDEDNIDDVVSADVTFSCVDDNPTRGLLAQGAMAAGQTLIDTGMGLYQTPEGRIGGTVRTTAANPAHNSHLVNRLPQGNPGDDPYGDNIQIAELNALNASHAVIRWKKTLGFYDDQELEMTHLYAISDNSSINEDQRDGDPSASGQP